MAYIARCQICHEPKPVLHPDIEDQSRYGPCMSDQCVHLRTLEPETGPLFNIAWLKASNEDQVTAREMRDEIYSAAREDGREITRAH